LQPAAAPRSGFPVRIITRIVTAVQGYLVPVTFHLRHPTARDGAEGNGYQRTGAEAAFVCATDRDAESGGMSTGFGGDGGGRSAVSHSQGWRWLGSAK